MKKLNESYLEIKKSKFIGYIYSIDSTEEIDDIINSIKKEHKKCKHVVYAYKFNNIERSFSDKEPSGTTRGLLDIIKLNNLDCTLIIVVRYFGGILLGSGPLTRTYTKVSSMLIKK